MDNELKKQWEVIESYLLGEFNASRYPVPPFQLNRMHDFIEALPETSFEEIVSEGIEAVRLTREYVGEEVLPEIEGWSWYDWIQKAEAALARFGFEPE